MVLAAAIGTDHPGSLIVAAITRVYTIAYVAKMIGEDEDWLHDLTIDMDFEDGRLTVYDVGDDGTTALTDFGIENLHQIIADLRADGRASASKTKNCLTRGPHRMDTVRRPLRRIVRAGPMT